MDLLSIISHSEIIFLYHKIRNATKKLFTMKHFIVHLILAISFFGLFANASQAQQATATLTGVVTDSNGAVIPGASVTATNSATNLSRTTSTNDEGDYVISSLPVGSYVVKVFAPNFDFRVFENINLNVGQTLSLNTDLEVRNLVVAQLKERASSSL